MKFLDQFQDHTYALLRIVTGFLFLWHGSQKLLNFPTEFTSGLNPLMYAAGSIELIGGSLVMIGLATRPAAFICSGMSAVGYWMVHGSKTFFPIMNGGELIALFCFCFLFIAARGTGVWGLGKD